MTVNTSVAVHDPYQLSVAILSVGSPLETSFILEVNIRNIIERSLASIKAAHADAIYTFTYTNQCDFDIEISTSSGAIIDSLTYITPGHPYLPFSEPLIESNEAPIQSISLK